MLSSMTGFSRVSCSSFGDQIIWECRSVNHRYLDISLRIPEAFSSFEADYRESIQAFITRGKIVAELSVIPTEDASRALMINESLVLNLLEAALKISDLTKYPPHLELRDLLKWPGVIKENHFNIASIAPNILISLNQAIQELSENRAREGQKLQIGLEEKFLNIQKACQTIRAAVPDLNAQFKERLLLKLKDLAVEIDQNRFEQELILHLNRADVLEELDRLDAHISEAKNIFKQSGSVGRRLDFLMQEFNREVNTIGSKSSNIGITQLVMSMKVWIEQIREQVQNIE